MDYKAEFVVPKSCYKARRYKDKNQQDLLRLLKSLEYYEHAF